MSSFFVFKRINNSLGCLDLTVKAVDGMQHEAHERRCRTWKPASRRDPSHTGPHFSMTLCWITLRTSLDIESLICIRIISFTTTLIKTLSFINVWILVISSFKLVIYSALVDLNLSFSIIRLPVSTTFQEPSPVYELGKNIYNTAIIKSVLTNWC